jgi:hypothetical protein
MHLSIDAFTLQVIEVGDQDRSGGKRRDIHSGERHREQGVRLERQFRIRSICFRPCPKESLMSALLSMNHAKEQMTDRLRRRPPGACPAIALPLPEPRRASPSTQPCSRNPRRARPAFVEERDDIRSWTRRSFEYEPVLARGVFFGRGSNGERTERGIEISLMNESQSVYSSTYVKMIVAGSRPSLDPDSRPISSASYSNPEPDHRRMNQLPGLIPPSRLPSKPTFKA